MRPWPKSVMLVWLQDTILSYGKRLKVLGYLSQAKTKKCRGTIDLSACWAVRSNSLKKTLAGRIRNFLEKEKFFNKWQNGFRSERIAMEHVFRLVEETQLGFTKKWKGGAIFIDVEKAFDLVWHDGLKYKLMNGSLSRKMVRLISSFLSDRTIKVNCCNNCSEEVTLNAGTPQGSVLSPLLFIIYVNDIPDMSSLNVRLSQFADDMGIWAHATNAKWVKAKLSKALKLIEAWCSKLRIKLNAGKTELSVFSVGSKPELIDLELFGKPIIQTETAKLQATEPVEVAKRDKLGRQTIYHLKSLQVLYTPCPWIWFTDNWSFKGITSEENSDLSKQVPETITWYNLQNENNRSAWPH